jgi:VIT1/CCC1 family predicted Fe2+/Mn2+ transporter
LAWGLTDAVMYVLGAGVEKSRRRILVRQLRETADPAASHRMIAAELPDSLTPCVTDETLEAIRRCVITLPLSRTPMAASDFAAALGVFAVVVLVTFPIVTPFLVFQNVVVALRVSHGLALAILFASGYLLGSYTGGKPWMYGLAITALGVLLVAVIMALGG